MTTLYTDMITIEVKWLWHEVFLLYFAVPYRDSVLTKLLQNALGGNSKTIMVSLKPVW